jgi:hypothetical protein
MRSPPKKGAHALLKHALNTRGDSPQGLEGSEYAACFMAMSVPMGDC